MMISRRRWRLAICLAALAAAAPAEAFELFGIHLWGAREEEEESGVIDPLSYEVTFVVVGSDAANLQGTLEQASSLYTERERPAAGFGGLLARARGDYRRILAALYNNAYYGGVISIEIAGREAANLTLDASVPRPAPVTVQVDPGPRFHFGRAGMVNAPPPIPAEDLNETSRAVIEAYRPGERANATAITAASALAVARWREISYAKAQEASRDAVADHATSLLDAVVVLEPGRPARFGATRVTGTRRVDPGFVAYMADLPAGAPFDPERVQAAQDRLARLDVFSSVRIVEDETIDPDGTLDMSVALEDGPARTIGLGATLSTIDGAGIEAFWEHRNLFGRAERLRFEANLTGLGLTGDVEEFDYGVGLTFTRPGVITPDTDFFASLSALAQDLETYREESATARTGFQRNFAEGLNGELSVFAQKARYEDFFGNRDFLLFGATARGDYDRRNNELDPTRGYYLAASLEPFYEAEFGNVAVNGAVEGRVYHGFGETERFVLAARAEVGSFVGPDDEESPPNQLFFAGGAGSIRGYAYRSVGIDVERDGEKGVIGGRSLLEGSGEARFRVSERFGAVGFVDAGYVASTSTFGGDSSDVRIGAGAGVRYFTGLGPLRVDVATPINPRKDDSLIAVYIGIGQAF